MAGKHASTATTYAGGISSPSTPRASGSPTLGSYVQGMRAQPFGESQNMGQNMQSQQFGSLGHASGTVKTGFNPLTYEGGAHRAPGLLG